MGALLADPRLPADAETIEVRDAASVSLVRDAVRRAGADAGLAANGVESLANAASELAHNQVRHAHGGTMAVHEVARDGVRGVEVVAIDSGPGIANPIAALRSELRGSGSGSLGVGLGAAYRLADEMDFDVRSGNGTFVAARKFAEPVPRSEVAILGRPCQGETVSGDDAVFVRGESLLAIGVADGLGHGALARDASAKALVSFRGHAGADPATLLARCDEAVRGTRGAVMGVALIDRKAGEITHAASGNVNTQVYKAKTVRRFTSTSRILGASAPGSARFLVEREALDGRHVLVMFSDGISSRTDLAGEPDLLREPPLVIAHAVLQRHGIATDDCMVLVATISA